MKNPSTILILTLGMAFSACQRPSEHGAGEPDGDASGSSTALESEVGESAKWTMPDAMMQHVRKLEMDVSTFESSGKDDHAELSARIDGHTRRLIASCTIEGEGHDALHDWLMPFLQLCRDYAAAPDAAARSARFEEIHDALTVFHERFE